MSMPFATPPDSAKTELETVIRWPLLVTAAGAGFLLLAVPVVLAYVTALKGDAAKDKVAVRPASLERANVALVATPARQVARYVPPTEAAPSPPVYVQSPRPPLKPVPVRKITPTAVKPPPAVDPVLQFPHEEAAPSFHMIRLDERTEVLLLRNLNEQAKEVDLDSVKGTREKLLPKTRVAKEDTANPRRATSKKALQKEEANEKKSPAENPPTIRAALSERADLRGLPMSGEGECRASPEEAKVKADVSGKLRAFNLVSFNSGSRGAITSSLTDLHTLLRSRKDWLEGHGLSTLTQMLQVEGFDARREFIDNLASSRAIEASRLLARQSLFDFSPVLREQAVKMLKERRGEEYRQVLLDGLRYPWAPVAAHAAEALVALDDRDSIPALVALLDEADPCAPYLDQDKKWVVREVVRINHLRNCLLCHAPSTERNDPLRGIVPTPDQRLPALYYAEKRGDFVRADVTYLRQDFSLMERVAKSDPWPEWQRFDYLVRTRELTADERASSAKKPRKPVSASYPQREAVLFALRELTGVNAGDRSADWYELLWVIDNLR